jgi:hypothetical protein
VAVQAARTWIRHEVTIEFQGRNASGRYSISRGTITVSTVFYGRKSTHVGGSTPASLARIMLRELAMFVGSHERPLAYRQSGNGKAC